MKRISLIAAAAGAVLALGPGTSAAHADPNPTVPGTPPAGLTADQIYAAVGADAFAELTNNLTVQYNAQAPTHTLASYDAVNPVTGVAGENITTKPGCSIVRPNGANGGITALTSNLHVDNDPTKPYCIDWVRSSRAKGSAAAEQSLTFYAQSRDAVSYATIGNAYAPTTPLTTTQLKGIFECTIQDWSEVGGQAGPIHVYLPPSTSATLTFFLQAIGTTLNNVNAGCNGLPTVFSSQQNDGRTLNGDPEGIAPYAVTKWAAQANQAPGIEDNRGGARVGLVNATTSPTTTATLGGTSYQVLNPDFATGASAAFGRLFYNVVRSDASAELTNVFKAGGYLCQNQDALLIPFGNTPLGNDSSQARYCGQTS
ncbi:substrate-binding domain-containing protein [Nocardioides ultimimeridianus]